MSFFSWLSVHRGQAEKEFKVEVEAIGKVRHKNLVGLLGYCAEGTQRYFLLTCWCCMLSGALIILEYIAHIHIIYYSIRLLVYEYVDNGNLEQWLHGDVGPVSPLTWEIRMKIAIGIARG